MDPAKLVIPLPEGGGIELAKRLIAAGLAPEQTDETTLIPIVTLVDTPADVARLVDVVLTHLAERAKTRPRKGLLAAPKGPDVGAEWGLPPAPLTPRDAFFAPTETIASGTAVGRISAEAIAPYPPGVPVLVRGEEITGATIEHLPAAAPSGVRIAYAADPTLATFQVVRRGLRDSRGNVRDTPIR